MKIRTKLLVGMAIVVLASTALGIYAAQSIRTMDGLITSVYDKAMMTSTFAQSASTGFVRVDRAVKAAGAARDAAELDRYVATVAASEKQFLEDLDVVRERALSAQSKAIVAEIIVAYEKWKPEATQHIARVRAALGRASGRPTGLRLNGSSEKYGQFIEEKLTALTDDAAEAGFRLREASNNLVKTTLSVTYGTVLAAVIASLVVAVVLTRGIASPLRALIGQLSELASGEGDLTKRIAVKSRDEVGELAHWLNTFVAKVHEIIGQVRTAADGVAAASEHVSSGAVQLKAGAEAQASSLQETAASLEQITAAVKQNADHARQANELALGARAVAEKGGQVVMAAVGSMTEINRSSKKIADIITVIDEIAFQTNLLALNAAVEAARAGEQGRGFAVVAAEVRNLAQRSAGAAKEIKALIQESVQKVESGAALAHESGRTLEEIVNSAKRVADIIAEMAAASAEQSQGIDQVNKAVTHVEQVTESSAARTEELSAAAAGMSTQAQRLQALVRLFKLDAEADAGALAVAAAPEPSPPSPARRPAPRPAPGRASRRGATDPVGAGAAAGVGTSRTADDGFEEF